MKQEPENKNTKICQKLIPSFETALNRRATLQMAARRRMRCARTRSVRDLSGVTRSLIHGQEPGNALTCFERLSFYRSLQCAGRRPAAPTGAHYELHWGCKSFGPADLRSVATADRSNRRVNLNTEIANARVSHDSNLSFRSYTRPRQRWLILFS